MRRFASSVCFHDSFVVNKILTPFTFGPSRLRTSISLPFRPRAISILLRLSLAEASASSTTARSTLSCSFSPAAFDESEAREHSSRMGPIVASEAGHVRFREDSEVILTQGHMPAPLSRPVEEERVPDEVRASKVARLSGGSGKDQDGETTEEVEGGDSEPISVEQALMLASQHKEHLLQILRQIAENFAKETERMNKQLQAHVKKVAEDIEDSYTSKSQAIMKLHQHNQKSALSLDSASRVLKNNQGAIEVIMRCCNSRGTQDEDSEA